MDKQLKLHYFKCLHNVTLPNSSVVVFSTFIPQQLSMHFNKTMHIYIWTAIWQNRA